MTTSRSGRPAPAPQSAVAVPSRLPQAIGLAVLCLAAPHQGRAQAAGDDATRLDRIEVTGTRIKRAELEDQVPVQTLSREDIERTGLTSISDVVQQITASGSALNTRFNSSGNFGFPPDGSGVGAGSATVDLRHLGSKRVLVLVDGLRWVNEASASGVGAATDLNTIPLAIVERIDILEDGASSLYGSDAIAGVVNIITRKEFDGARVTVDYGEYEEGDGASRKVDFAWGGRSERARWFLGASWTDQDGIGAGSRELSRLPTPGTGLAFGSSGTPDGRFIFVDPNTGITQDITPNAGDGAGLPAYDGSDACARSDDYHCFATPDRFNFAPYNLLLTPSERKGLFGQFRFDISPSTTWYAKALYNRRESANRAAPEPIFLGPDAGTGNPQADNIFISGANPYNPFGFDLDSASNLILIGRRPVEGGPRLYEQEVDTWYVATGLEGAFDLGDRGWFWDLNLVRSENEAEQVNTGSYNIRHIANALGDPAVCATIAGCVPLDIFGGAGSITPEMLAYIQPVVRDRSDNTLSLASANASGDLFDLPAGPLSMAAGYEYRKYEGSYQPDALTVAGDYNGVPSLPTSGEYDVNEVFAEFSVPLLSDSPWAEALDLSIAGRYSDYSTFGGEFTPKYGLRWQLVDEFLIRATFAEGFRAPSIGELYGSASRFDATLSDPCSTGPNGEPPRGAAGNCAALGVPAGYQQPNPQISVTTGGNEALDPETSDSFSAGFVWSPSFLENSAVAERVDLEVTFYRHEVEGAIQAIDAQTQLDLCVDTLDPTYCDGITRASTGGINGFNNRLTNLGVIKTDGWDADLFWTLRETDAGRFAITWRNTWVGRYEAIGADGALQPRQVGVEVNDGAIPQWTSNLALDWRRGPWSASWTLRFIDELVEECGDATGFAICSDPEEGTNRLPSTTYHDAQLAYRLDVLDGLELAAGGINVFGKEPPACLSCSLNGYDPSTYDIPGGAYWYVRADLSF